MLCFLKPLSFYLFFYPLMKCPPISFTVPKYSALCLSVGSYTTLNPNMICCTSLYFTVPQGPSLYLPKLQSSSQHTAHVTLYLTVSHCTPQHYTVPHCTSLYLTVLHSTSLNLTIHNYTKLCLTALHCT